MRLNSTYIFWGCTFKSQYTPSLYPLEAKLTTSVMGYLSTWEPAILAMVLDISGFGLKGEPHVTRYLVISPKLAIFS